MNLEWDIENVFNKIIKREIPAEILAENETCIAIKDVNPKADFHALIIPKLGCRDFSDFVRRSNGDTAYFWNFIQEIIEKNALKSYKLIANTGAESGQCVFHFHVHLMSGNIFLDEWYECT